MGTILEELQEHETFVNKASGKAKKLLKSLFRRVDWMKATLGVGKLVAAYFAGPHAAPALYLVVRQMLRPWPRKPPKKVEEIDPEEAQRIPQRGG